MAQDPFTKLGAALQRLEQNSISLKRSGRRESARLLAAWKALIRREVSVALRSANVPDLISLIDRAAAIAQDLAAQRRRKTKRNL